MLHLYLNKNEERIVKRQITNLINIENLRKFNWRLPYFTQKAKLSTVILEKKTIQLVVNLQKYKPIHLHYILITYNS